jgi:predicted nucleic acid-binding protein
MVALDSHLLIRFLTGDDPSQYQASRTIFAQEQIFLSESVLLETGWLLQHAYGYTPQQISHALSQLCGLPNVTLASPERVQFAFTAVAAGVGWSEAFHWAQAEACTQLLTVDPAWAEQAEVAQLTQLAPFTAPPIRLLTPAVASPVQSVNEALLPITHLSGSQK